MLSSSFNALSSLFLIGCVQGEGGNSTYRHSKSCKYTQKSADATGLIHAYIQMRKSY